MLITGACGNIGRKLRAAWDDVYDLVLLDADGRRGRPRRLQGRPERARRGVDHPFPRRRHGRPPGGEPQRACALDELIEPNIDAMANVFNAAALAGVDRIIFASSNHVMGGYRDAGDDPITVDLPPRPDNPYGDAQARGRAARPEPGHGVRPDVHRAADRLGPGRANRPETLPDDWSRKMWLSNDDLVRLFDAAVEAEIEDRSFVVVNGVSRNHGTRWDLSDAAEILGYLPEDDAFASRQRAESLDEVS